jgi:DNA-binding NarL/FixJ family response regulator
MKDIYHILLADDHVLLRQGLRNIIEKVGALKIVGEAGDGLELLRLLKKLTPHLIILDISMPHLRGLEAVREIRAGHPAVKVLMLTMHKDKEYLHEAISAGAHGYLLKEDADTELYSAIKTIREGKLYLSPFFSKGLTEDWAQNLRGEQTLSSEEALTTREREILKLIAEGRSSKEIAELLFISPRTVERHRANMMEKLNLRKTADLVRYALKKEYI